MSSSSSHRYSSSVQASAEASNRTSGTHHYSYQYSNRHRHHEHLQSTANSQARLEQLFDEQDHKRCSEGNRKALLSENLDQLRGLVKVLEADNWKYQTNNKYMGGSLAWASRTPSASTGGASGHN